MNFLIFWLMLDLKGCSGSLLDWFSWSNSPEFTSGGVPLLQVPYEELKPEEKFLVEANKITGLKLNQLDACQHKLIVKLKSSCGELSDEELAKLAVNLLNCQADVEGRRTYPCTQAMSLKECTQEMDGETWNAYHIMSNRARAVCYVARQEQFRALAEMTINRLVSTARIHLDKMSAINENQEKVERATELALDRISRSQKEVLVTYAKLRRLESDFASSLGSDREALTQLAGLINSGRDLLATVLTDLKAAIEETGLQLNKQKKAKSEEHKKVVNDLTQTQEIIQNLNFQIGNMSQVFTENIEASATEFDSSRKYLKTINSTLSQIYSRIETLEKISDNKTSFVFRLVGHDGERLDELLVIGAHVSSLCLAMLLASFLQLWPRHRLLLITSSLANLSLYLYTRQNSITLSLLYLSLVAVALFDFLVTWIFAYYKHTKTSGPATSSGKLNSVRENGFRNPYTKVHSWLAEDNPDSGLRNGTLPLTPLTARDDDEMSTQTRRSTRSQTAAIKRCISPPRSEASSVSGRKSTCSAQRLNGQRCKLPALSGQTTCRVHQLKR